MTPTRFSLSSLSIFVCLLAHVHTQELDKNYCPTSVSQSDTIYSPFVPWWVYYPSQQCWAWASCIYIRADESRKQQFAATALVMGLIPLTFKDIAWPGRRVILLSKPLNAGLEVLVRGLGMEPRWPFEKQTDKENVVRAWWLESDLATLTWGWAGIACLLTAVCLVLSSGALLVAELYSKRSALGCPYPAFVFTWYVVGFVPAAMHTFCSKMRRLRKRRKSKALSRNGAVVEDKEVEMIISAVQGGEEWWIVQLIWAIFYIAGTLIYTSIMAVTVIELFVWVVVSAAMGASCKLLAFFICLQTEKKLRPTRNRSFLEPTRADSVLRMANVIAEPDSMELLRR